jgi:Zn-dependent protease with chaperone function
MTRLENSAPRPAVAFVLALLLSAAVASAQTKIKSGFNLFSANDDVQIGQQSAAEAERQLPMLNDAQVDNYVNNVGQRLARNAGGPQFQYRFRVVNASDINAFALPGGFIYVNRGAIEQSRNEGELAGVLAHEISHVALRHGTHQASKAYLAQAGIGILGGILGGNVGSGTAQVINAVGGLGLNALFLKYGRDLESQADVRGAQILAASGYSPADMVNFFQTLERVDTSKKTNWLSDHPAPPDRIARIQKEAQLLHVSNTPTTNVAEFNSVRSRLGRYGAAPTSRQIAQGAAGNAPQSSSSGGRGRSSASINVEAPSRTFSTYTNPTRMFQVAYPANWRVYREGNNGVTLAPNGGIGNTNGSTDIVYGAMINHYDPIGASGMRGNISLSDATDDLINSIRSSSPHLGVVNGSGQRLRLAGGTAIAATLRGRDPNTGIDERVTVVTRQLSDEHLLYLLFITPERDAQNYSSVLNEMVSSMKINPSAGH